MGNSAKKDLPFMLMFLRQHSSGFWKFAHTEVIEIHEAAGGSGCEVEQGEAIAHEVRQGVGHLKGPPERRPRLTVQAVEEARTVRPVLEVTVDFQENVLVGER